MNKLPLTSQQLAKLINLFVDALNECKRLSKYVLIFPDKDYMFYMLTMKNSNSLIIGSTLHYLIRQYDTLIDRRIQELKERKIGAVPPDGLPKVIWIRMLKHPFQETVMNSRSKFNSILEERILDGKEDRHKIMSITIPFCEFDRRGNLTETGKAEFWREVGQAIKKFDIGDILLKPRKIQPAVPLMPKKQDGFIKRMLTHHRHQQSSNKAKSKSQSPRYKLKTPPRASSRKDRWSDRHDRCDRSSSRRCEDRPVASVYLRLKRNLQFF